MTTFRALGHGKNLLPGEIEMVAQQLWWQFLLSIRHHAGATSPNSRMRARREGDKAETPVQIPPECRNQILPFWTIWGGEKPQEEKGGVLPVKCEEAQLFPGKNKSNGTNLTHPMVVKWSYPLFYKEHRIFPIKRINLKPPHLSPQWQSNMGGSPMEMRAAELGFKANWPCR